MIFYEKFSDTDEAGAHLFIEHNQSDYDAEGRQVGLYIHGGSEFGTYSVDDIPRMIEVLQNIYDDFEANKPKGPKDVGEVLANYPNGTIIKFDRDYNASYVKIDGKWFDPRYRIGEGETFLDGWAVEDWKFTVKYNPKEDN